MNPKKLAADKAVDLIQDDMVVGLGTGSTAFFAIQRISERIKEGLRIRAVASSLASAELANEAGIPLAGMTEIDAIDITIDGADAVDPSFNLVKGGGGALTREKILAANSRLFVVIVDESKLVRQLGRFPVAVEVIPFGYNLVFPHLERLGCKPVLRQGSGQFFRTDNGNWIVDCYFETIADPAGLNLQLNGIPGVIESGIFPEHLVHTVIAGYENGEVKLLRQQQWER